MDILPPHSFSTSRQFVVYARDGAVRGSVATFADETKAGLLEILGLKDEWKTPIVIDLRAPEPGMPDARPPVQLTLGQTGAGLKIELDLLIGEAGSSTHIRTELVRALLLELAYRDHASLPAGRDYTTPPPWLVEGLAAYLENREDGVSAHLFAALLPTTQAMALQEFLSKDPAEMDSTSRSVYQAYSYNLVCLLLRDMAGSRENIVAFVRDLPETSPADARSAAALVRHFPQLADSPDALEKWWTLGLAKLAEFDQYQAMTVEETDQALEKLLTFRGPPVARGDVAPQILTLHDFKRLAANKSQRALLARPRTALLELTGRGHPLYRPILIGYEQLLAQLERGKTGGAQERIEELELARKEVLHRREQIADYLNWYEATQVTTRSNDFDSYFQTARQVERDARVHRPDPISAYLASVDNEFR